MSVVDTQKMWTVEEVASMLHVYPDTVRRAIEVGNLRAMERQGVVFITEDDMKEFVKSGNPFQHVAMVREQREKYSA